MAKSSKIGLFLIDNIIWMLLLIFVVINLLVTPKFGSYNNIINIFYHSSVLSMLVLAQGLILLLGYMDLSIESTLVFAPTIGILLLTKWFPGITPLGAVLATIIIGGLVGAFNGLMITRFKINPFLQTLSLLIMLRGFVLFILPLSVFEFSPIVSFIGGAKVFLNIPFAVLLMIVIYILFHFIITSSTIGRQIVAVGGNSAAAFIAGVNVGKVIFVVFIVSGMLASLAGLIMVGRQESVTNAMGTGLVFEAFAGAVLGGVSMKGGIGKVSGMLGGVLLLGVIDNSLNLLGMNAFLIYAAKGAIIWIAIVLDQTKEKLRSNIYFREDIKRFRIAVKKENFKI